MSSGYKYKVLFEVRVLHHFLLDEATNHFEGMTKLGREKNLLHYSVLDLLDVFPTEPTIKTLSGNKLIFKKTQYGFLVAVRTDIDDDTLALADLRLDGKLSFYMKKKNSSFMNFSSLSLKAGATKTYYFNNRNKAALLHPSLTKIAPEFDSTAAANAAADGDPDTFAYYPGDILVDSNTAPTEVYEAVQSNNNDVTSSSDWRKDSPAAVYDNSITYNEGEVVSFTDSGTESLYQALSETTGNLPTDILNWEKLKDLPLHYVTTSDLIDILPRLYNFIYSSAGISSTIIVRDIDNNIVITDEFTSTAQNLTYQVDMRNLQEGKYSIEISDNAGPTTLLDQEFFLMNTNHSISETFGIIEIFLGSSHGQYSLVDASNVVSSNIFELRIKNRSTVWRYFDRSDTLVHESSFNPLTKKGYIAEQLNGNDLPNPDPHIIQPSSTQYYSDIYINS